MPLIGDHAPEFHAMTTQGKIDFPADLKEVGLSFFHIRLTLHRFVQQNLLPFPG